MVLGSLLRSGSPSERAGTGKDLDPGPRFQVPSGGPCPHPRPLEHYGPLFLPSPLGLQDKLNKRDKEVTALMSQTETLRAQVSGKSPSRRADAGGSHGGSSQWGVDWVGSWVRVPCPTLPREVTWASPPAWT